MREAFGIRFGRAAGRSLLCVALLFGSGGARAGQATPDEPPAEESPNPEEPPPLDLRVNAAVDRACAFLLEKQNDDGSWHVEPPHPIGRTSLAMLALLHGGVPATDPRMKRGEEWLIRQLREWRAPRPTGTPEPRRSIYETGVTLNLLHALGNNPRYVDEMQPLVDHLARTFRRGERLWGYPDGEADLSNSQYALLGLRSAQLRGVEPHDARTLWLDALQGVLRCHTPLGGFSYRPGQLPRGSMTLAGLTMIRLCSDALSGWPRASRDLKEAQSAAKLAESWLVTNLDFARHPEGKGYTPDHRYYYLYAIERWAVFEDLRRIAERDWYREGAEVLLADQNSNGSWGAYHNVEDAAFALLFLRKASLTVPDPRVLGAAEALPARVPEPPGPTDAVASLRTWFVCGTFPGTAHADDALVVDSIDEAKVRPAAKKRAGKSRWMPWTAPADLVDLWEATRQSCNATVKDYVSAYAATWLHVDADTEAILFLWSDDGARVFLDGVQVHESHHHGGVESRVPLALSAGAHLLLLKIENVQFDLKFRARIGRPDGTPTPEVTASLEPPR